MIFMNIRQAEMTDLQDLMEIYNKSGKKKRAFNTYPITEWILQRSRVFLIIETPKGKKLGFIVVREKGDTAGIDLLITIKGPKTDDIKKALIFSAISKMKASTLEVRVPNDMFARFLKSNGFEKIDEIQNMYGPKKSGLVLVKSKDAKKISKITNVREESEILKENIAKLNAIKKDEFGPDMLG